MRIDRVFPVKPHAPSKLASGIAARKDGVGFPAYLARSLKDACKSSPFSFVICALLFALIAYSFVVRVQMYMLGTSLWNDEALLAENIAGRSMAGMLTPPLTNMQTAPALYLICVKAIASAFGASESALRAFSFIAFAVMIAAQAILMRKAFGVRWLYTLFALAASATFLYYMKYSAELKPYMGDAAFVLVVFAAYMRYRARQRCGASWAPALLLAALCSVCLLLSSPAAFAVGAVFITELAVNIARKDTRRIPYTVGGGMLFAAVFAANYMLWLKPIATDGGMVYFWSERKFDFLPFSPERLAHDASIIKDLLDPLHGTAWLVVTLALCGFVLTLIRKSVCSLAVGVFLLLLLAASACAKYPLMNRLWMFAFVLLFIYAFVFVASVSIAAGRLCNGAAPLDPRLARAADAILPIAISLCLLAPNASFSDYGKGEPWTLTAGCQANPLIAYVASNIKDGELLYSYESANVILRYKNGYESDRIGGAPEANIVYGTQDYEGDADALAKAGGAYVLFYHSYMPLSADSNIRRMIDMLQQRGYMDLVMNEYYTPLFWFTPDPGNVKAMAALDVFDLQTDGGQISGLFRIDNTGQTIIAPDWGALPYPPGNSDDGTNYGRTYLTIRKDGDSERIPMAECTAQIAPGESADIWVVWDGLAPGDYEIDLVADGEYAFSDLGMPPLRLLVT